MERPTRSVEGGNAVGTLVHHALQLCLEQYERLRRVGDGFSSSGARDAPERF